MAKRIVKKSVPWFVVLFLIGSVLVLGLNFGFKNPKVKADTADTSVTVGNVAPEFTVITTDNSDATNPTNAGDTVTFAATATDANGDQWKLLVCKTEGVSGTDCDGGATDRWCVSASAVDSGSQNTCTYNTTDSDPESNNWYSYACDASACSAVENTNSPFKVNHRPSFTVFQDDSPLDPAGTITWTTTASDSDTDGTPDTVSLYVCKENDFTGTACGAGGTWCSVTGQASNPSCTATAPRPDGTYTAYGFVIDNHNFAASGGSQGTDSSVAVNNVAPTISAATVSLLDTDETGDLTLTVEQGETTGFKVTFTVTDNNSCQNISGGNEIASALTHVRMSEITQAQCDDDAEDNNNNCYANAQNGTGGSCSQTGTCGGTDDTDIEWTCIFPLQYHADPTTTGAPKAAYNWVAAVQATDDDSAASSLVDGTGTNEMGKFMSYDLNTTSIAYGTVAPNNASSGQTTTIEATGNVGLDANLSGTNMCDDYPTCSGDTIAVGQQKYHLTTLDFNWDTEGTALTTTATEAEVDCAKTTVTNNPATDDFYWKIKIPLDQPAKTYTGQDTIEGKIDNETYGT